MKGELHLPDLPDIPVALSPAGGPPQDPARRTRPRWTARARESLMAYLPLLMMTVLALGTWLIAKNTPGLLTAKMPEAVRHEPDYTVDRFTLQRFDVTGRLKVEIVGDQMRHFPDDDMMEVDRIRVVSTDDAGRRMTATALKGRANGDGSEVWLDGQAHVVSELAGEVPVEMDGEHLRAEPKMKRVESDWPVIVHQGDSEFHADGLLYDADTRLMTLRGSTHATLQPAQAHRQASSAPQGK